MLQVTCHDITVASHLPHTYLTLTTGAGERVHVGGDSNYGSSAFENQSLFKFKWSVIVVSVIRALLYVRRQTD